MADQITPDDVIAEALVVSAEQTGDTATSEAVVGVDTTGVSIAQRAAEVTLDPANPTYIDQLRKAGLSTQL
jgi:hypothetical protein